KEDIRNACGEALARMGSEAGPAVPALLVAFGNKAPIKAIGPAAIPELIRFLPGPDAKSNPIPEYFLKQFGGKATPALLGALGKDKTPAVRRAVAGILRGSSWGDAKDIVPGLVQALVDMDEQVRQATANSILSFRKEAQPFLEQPLRGKDQ